jgi:dTMP kinase
MFITVEGGEGSGKTSVIARIAKDLKTDGAEVMTTREPGGIEIAEKIRAILLDPAHDRMDARTEALLYAAARRQHLVERVLPALQAGKIVICDRFLDSSLVYQGIARGLGLEAVLGVNRFAIGSLMPDLTLLLDVDPEVGLRRIQGDAGREVNRLDLEGLDFHRKVREGYLEVARLFPGRIRVVSAERPLDQVAAEVRGLLRQKLGGTKNT